jgi:hypothetical protein
VGKTIDVFDRAAWPSTAKHARAITVTKWLAIIFGIGSVLVLVSGSIHILLAWK